MVLHHPERNETARLLLHLKHAIKVSFIVCEKMEKNMKEYYNEDIDSVRKRVNGSLKPLTNQQVKANQENYGLNELLKLKQKVYL